MKKVKDFVVTGILDRNSILSDPSLMPDFPGISGSTTCSGWDAVSRSFLTGYGKRTKITGTDSEELPRHL
jgi:hypothetical protein